MIRTSCLILALLVSGCYTHKVDTFQKWCEQITDVNLREKYEPFWAVFFAVSFEGDAIRDDFVKFLNGAYMEKVQNRAPRMVWREGTQLHVVNLSSLLVLEPEEFIGEWRSGIEKDKRGEHKGQVDRCLYGTVTSLFDNFHIHSMKSDGLGIKWTDSITTISTDRQARFQKHRLKPL